MIRPKCRPSLHAHQFETFRYKNMVQRPSHHPGTGIKRAVKSASYPNILQLAFFLKNPACFDQATSFKSPATTPAGCPSPQVQPHFPIRRHLRQCCRDTCWGRGYGMHTIKGKTPAICEPYLHMYERARCRVSKT